MRILVTGHLGYLGSQLVPQLVRDGHTVFGIDNELFKRCTFNASTVEIPCLKRDIRDIQAEDLFGYDAVIHLAALSNDPLGDLNPRATYEINYSAAVRLASLAKYAEVGRFIFSSSCAVYGASLKRYVTEQSPPQPTTTFATAKLRAEHDISRLADDKFSPVFLRRPTLYGISPYHRTDSVVNNLVAWAAARGSVYLKTDGSSWRPLMHVEDVASAFVAATYAPTRVIHNQVYNVIRTEENYQVATIADKVQRLIPNSRIEYAPDAPHDERSYRVDGSKIANQLPQWSPRWNLDSGIVQLRDAYSANAIKLEDFEGPRYKRVTYMKFLISSERLDNSLRWTKRPNSRAQEAENS